MAWGPPSEPHGLTWISSHPKFESWRRSSTTTLHILGSHRLELSELSLYISRHVADSEPSTLVAKFSFITHATSAQMLAAIIFQLLSQRPRRFDNLTGTQKKSAKWSTRTLKAILRRIIRFTQADGEDVIILVDAMDLAQHERRSRDALSLLFKIQQARPHRLILTSSEIPSASGGDILYVDADAERRQGVVSEDRGNHQTPAAGLKLRGGSGSRPEVLGELPDFFTRDASQPIRNDDGSTPLHVACEVGDPVIVEQMLEDGADVNVTDKNGRAPLHIACKWGHTNVTMELLERGSNPLTPDSTGLTPLHVACEASRCEETVRALLGLVQGRLPIDLSLRTPLHVAVTCSGAEIFQEILNHYMDCWGMSKDYAWPVALGELLLREDRYGRNVLHIASMKGDVDCIEQIFARLTSLEVLSENQSVRPSPSSLRAQLLNNGDLQGRCPLHLAAQHGRAEVVELLFQESRGEPIDAARDIAGKTPLHWACINGHQDAAAMLLRCGEVIDTADDHGMTPTLLASLHGHLELVHLLVQNGASLLPLDEGTSALHEATRSGSEDLVSYLLQLQPMSNVNRVPIRMERKVDRQGRLPVMLAALRGNYPLFRALLLEYDQLLQTDLDGRNILHYAAEGGNHTIINSIASRQLPSLINAEDNRGQSPLQLAARSGIIEVVNALIEHGALLTADQAIHYAATDEIGLRLLQLSAGFVEDPDLSRALQDASRKGHLGTLRTLIKEYCPERLDPNCIDPEGKTPLILAAEAGQIGCIKILITVTGIAVAKGDRQQRTALSYAAQHGHLGVVEMLAEYLEVDVDLEDAEHCSPLFYAAMNGHLNVTKALVVASRARRPSQSNFFGPVCAAARAGHGEIVRFLLRASAGAGLADPSDRTDVLEHALREGHAGVVRTLFGHGWRNTHDDLSPLHVGVKHIDVVREVLQYVPVDTPALGGVTALGLAVQNGYIDSVLVLLDSGADVLCRDTQGRTPLHYAVSAQQESNPTTRKRILPGEILGLLLQSLNSAKSAEVADNQGNTPLYDAVVAGDISSVRVLLAREDSDITRVIRDSRSALRVAIEGGHPDMIGLILDMVEQLPVKESHYDLVAVAAHRKPGLQVRLMRKLGVNLREHWVHGLAAGDNTGIVAKFLTEQGVGFSEPDEHGWNLMDVVYATDRSRCRNKSDQEITRIAHQPYRYPTQWVPVLTVENSEVLDSGRTVLPSGTHRMEGPSALSANMQSVSLEARRQTAFRADHPIPPIKAYCFEVEIIDEGRLRRYVQTRKFRKQPTR